MIPEIMTAAPRSSKSSGPGWQHSEKRREEGLFSVGADPANSSSAASEIRMPELRAAAPNDFLLISITFRNFQFDIQ